MGAISDVLRFLKLKPPKTQRKKGGYWQRRAQMYYYQVVKDWINAQEPGAWILDIGSRTTPIVLEGDFTRRTMLDIKPFNQAFKGVEQIVCDWMEYQTDQKADLVLCLQVLEHLPDHIVGPFAQKLLATGRRVIISVPHLWAEGDCGYHLQDPVDLDKLVSWTRRPPVKHYIEQRDAQPRLIAMFE